MTSAFIFALCAKQDDPPPSLLSLLNYLNSPAQNIEEAGDQEAVYQTIKSVLRRKAVIPNSFLDRTNLSDILQMRSPAFSILLSPIPVSTNAAIIYPIETYANALYMVVAYHWIRGID